MIRSIVANAKVIIAVNYISNLSELEKSEIWKVLLKEEKGLSFWRAVLKFR